MNQEFADRLVKHLNFLEEEIKEGVSVNQYILSRL